MATLEIVQLTGTSPTETVVTSVGFGTEDMVDPLQIGTSDWHPIALPSGAAGSGNYSYSFWVNVALRENTGSFTDIRNIRWYIDTNPSWALGTDGEKRLGNRDSNPIGVPPASYQQASGTVDESGDPIEDGTNGHNYYNGQSTPTKVWGDFPSNSPAQVDDNFYTSAFTSYHIVMQLLVDTDANHEHMSGGQFAFRASVVE